jgi:hypothetical protein
MKPYTMKTRPIPLYTYISENGGWDNFSFKIIKEYAEIAKTDLLNEEKNQIKEKTPLCNVQTPIATKEEKNETNRANAKIWRTNNPDKVKEYADKSHNTEAYIAFVNKRCSTHITCECGGTYTKQNKTNHYKRNIHTTWEKNIIKE